MTRLSELAGKFNELVAGVNDPPYLDQFDRDYIKKLYDQINNPQKKNLKINKPIQKGIPGLAPDIELTDHGIPTKKGGYVVPSGTPSIREQMDFIPGKGLQFRIENEDGPPTYRPPTEQELKQYEHEANPLEKNKSMKIGSELVASYPLTVPDFKGKTKAYQNWSKGMRNKLTGEPLYHVPDEIWRSLAVKGVI